MDNFFIIILFFYIVPTIIIIYDISVNVKPPLKWCLAPIFFTVLCSFGGLLMYLNTRNIWKRAFDIKRATESLKNSVNIISIINYLTLIDKNEIPNNIMTKDELKAGYYLIKQSNNNNNLKEHAKIVMLNNEIIVD